MERMKDLEEMLRELSEKYKNSKSVEVYEEDLEGWFKIIDDLREENKSLKANVEFLHQCLDDRDKSIQYAEEENKKLKSDLAFERTMLDNVRAEYKSSQEVIKKLKEKIERWEKCFKKGGFNPQDVECLMEEDTLQELRDIGKI